MSIHSFRKLWKERSEMHCSWTGQVQLRKRSFIPVGPDAGVELLDRSEDLIGHTIQFRLVGMDGKTTGKENMQTKLVGFHRAYSVDFEVDAQFGTPAALLVENHHTNQIFLHHVTLTCAETVVHFPCNSWVYNVHKYGRQPRIFFSNQAYLPQHTPLGLRALRAQALQQLRGEVGTPSHERRKPDRVYDYDVYNDLGDARDVLGGSQQLPYPRRCRTGRGRSKKGQLKSSGAFSGFYVPRDEQFDAKKDFEFGFESFKSLVHLVVPEFRKRLETLSIWKSSKFKSFREIHTLYTKRSDSKSITSKLLDLGESVGVVSKPVRQLSNPEEYLLNFSLPQIIQAKGVESSKEWKLDEEFGRQTLSGVNPMVIQRLQTFPPVGSSITAEDIQRNLDGLDVQEALAKNKLYIVDYHDAFLPFVEDINALPDCKMYASRTIFFFTNGTLKPIAIELSESRHSSRGGRVFVPPHHDEEVWLWHLAKAHATINDACYHEVISHWLKTHACMEPFIIASHRHLSALHPLCVLLAPHFKDTMKINALARQVLINAHDPCSLSGIIEMGFSTDRYSMKISSAVYKSWRFHEQGLPADLIKRGMAKENNNGLELFIEDYPYAVDGLDIWFAIQSWVTDYLSIYYKDDMAVEEDEELQSWWAEIKEKGHGDKMEEDWRIQKFRTKKELEEVVVTIIWIASALHAAVNFGQYAYGGFMPNRPTRASQLIPAEGSEKFEKLLHDPNERFYLESLSDHKQTKVVMATLEILSNHSQNEEYLGQRNTPHWTSDERVLRAFNKFKESLDSIERQIHNRNKDPKLKNRNGPVHIPYTLLIPTSEPGMTGKGIPNSISI